MMLVSMLKTVPAVNIAGSRMVLMGDWFMTKIPNKERR